MNLISCSFQVMITITISLHRESLVMSVKQAKDATEQQMTHLIWSPSDFSISGFVGEDAPNVSPFLLHCDDDSDESWSHPLVGKMSRDPEKYCSSSCNRQLACCRPQHPDKISVMFILKTPKGMTTIGTFDDPMFDMYLKDTSNPIALFVPGYTNNYLQTPQFNDTAKLYVASGFNFIIIDWHIANSVYAQAVYNTRTVGAMIGYFLNKYDLAPDAICIGFSLGAHICGEAGKWLKRRNFSKIAACHMLDPAGPFFDGCHEAIRQNKDDCDIVNVIHATQNVSTSIVSTLMAQGFGSRHSSGHCDFWINDALAWKQPGCFCFPGASHSKYFVQNKAMNTAVHCIWCAHFRVLDFYLSEVRKSCRRIGLQSNNCGNVNECSPMQNGTRMYMPPYDACNNSMRMDFRVLTVHRDHPYC